MDQDYIFWLEMTQKFHDAFGVSVGRETHIVDLHLDVHDFVINRDFLLSAEDLVANCARHAIAWDDYRVLLVSRPFFEGLQAESTV